MPGSVLLAGYESFAISVVNETRTIIAMRLRAAVRLASESFRQKGKKSSHNCLVNHLVEGVPIHV